MKEAWCLATNNAEATAREIMNYYAKHWTIEPLAKLPQPDEPVALLAFAERACRWIFWPDAANSAICTTSERICGVVDRLHPLCAARGGRV
jgi:hypothetical protein